MGVCRESEHLVLKDLEEHGAIVGKDIHWSRGMRLQRQFLIDINPWIQRSILHGIRVPLGVHTPFLWIHLAARAAPTPIFLYIGKVYTSLTG